MFPKPPTFVDPLGVEVGPKTAPCENCGEEVGDRVEHWRGRSFQAGWCCAPKAVSQKTEPRPDLVEIIVAASNTLLGAPILVDEPAMLERRAEIYAAPELELLPKSQAEKIAGVSLCAVCGGMIRLREMGVGVGVWIWTHIDEGDTHFDVHPARPEEPAEVPDVGGNFCSEMPKFGLWVRFFRWLFPWQTLELPKAPGMWLDCIHLNAETEISFLDRFRVLVSGRIQTRAYIVCENTAGGTMSSMVVYPLPPRRFMGSDIEAAPTSPASKQLTEEGERLANEFHARYGDGNCSCHLHPPCGSCTDPGNPVNLAETPELWEEVPVEVPAAEEPAQYDLAIHSNPDAKAWAEFFVKTVREMAERNTGGDSQKEVRAEVGDIALDESYMLGWFANAMMAMHDYMEGKRQRQSQEPLFLKSITLPAWATTPIMREECGLALAQGMNVARCAKCGDVLWGWVLPVTGQGWHHANLSLPWPDHAPVANEETIFPGAPAGCAENVNFRILEPGEIVQKGDQYSRDDGYSWKPVTHEATSGKLIPGENFLYRRLVQGGVGLYEASQAMGPESFGGEDYPLQSTTEPEHMASPMPGVSITERARRIQELEDTRPVWPYALILLGLGLSILLWLLLS